MAGAAGFIVGVILGLRATQELAVLLSTVIQLILYSWITRGLAAFVMSHAIGSYWAVALGLVVASLYLLNLMAVLRARLSRRPYPWVLLRWTFTLAALAVLSAYVYTISGLGQGLGPALKAGLICSLPASLQATALWVRGVSVEPPQEEETGETA